jgi:hypothetical protein
VLCSRIALDPRLLRRRSQTKSVSALFSSARRRAISDARRAFCALLAHRARSPPTSSSFADEERVCSLLLSTAARDFRRSQSFLCSARASRSIPAYFVVVRRRRACLLSSPQHGDARFPTLAELLCSARASRSIPAYPSVGHEGRQARQAGTVLQQPFRKIVDSMSQPLRAMCHRLGQEMPSSFSMVRNKGRLSPTTLW